MELEGIVERNEEVRKDEKKRLRVKILQSMHDSIVSSYFAAPH